MKIRILPFLFIFLIAGIVSLVVFQQSNHLKSARQAIKKSQKKVDQSMDSLDRVLELMGELKAELDEAVVKLEVIKAERDILEMEIQKKKANNAIDLTRLKKEILKRETERDSLQSVAQKFDL